MTDTHGWVWGSEAYGFRVWFLGVNFSGFDICSLSGLPVPEGNRLQF